MFDWTAFGVICAIIGVSATGVMYVVRSEIRAVKDLVVLDRTTSNLRLEAMERTIIELKSAVVGLVDYKWQLKLLDERVVAQGQRLDDVIRRFNIYTDMEVKKLVDTVKGISAT